MIFLYVNTLSVKKPAGDEKNQNHKLGDVIFHFFFKTNL